MPVSDPYQLPFMLEAVARIQPKRVLDVGIGMGVVGMLLRQYLDVCGGRLQRDEWQLRLDGVEIFMPYRNPIWAYAYDTVHAGDAAEILPTLGEYDLILLCDVIEHFEKEAGRALLDRCLSKASWVVVTSPKGEYRQGAAFGNIHETHRSVWGKSDFRFAPSHYHAAVNTFMVVLAREPGRIRALKLNGLPSIRSGFNHVARRWVRRMRDRYGRSGRGEG